MRGYTVVQQFLIASSAHTMMDDIIFLQGGVLWSSGRAQSAAFLLLHQHGDFEHFRERWIELIARSLMTKQV